MKQILIYFVYFSGLLLAASLGTGCEQHGLFHGLTGPRSGVGLQAEGDLLVFPGIKRAGEEGSRLIIKAENGVHTLPMPKKPFLAQSLDMHFDREGNGMCGIFKKKADERREFYSCFSFRPRRWKALTPKDYIVSRVVWSADRETVYMQVTAKENILFRPWFFIVEVDVKSGKQKSFITLDPKTTAGVPQRIILSPDEKRLYVVVAPFGEGSFRVAFGEPHILQVVDLEQERVVHERVVPPFIFHTGFSEDGSKLLLYSRTQNTLHAYDIARDTISSVVALKSSSSRFYQPYLVPTSGGVFMIDQTKSQTLVRRLDAGADTLETTALDFVAYHATASDDGRRLFFREFNIEPEEYERGIDDEREEVVHAVDVHTLEIVQTQTMMLPGDAFTYSSFFVLADNR